MFGLGAVLAKFLSAEIDASVVAFLALFIGGLLLAFGLVLTRHSLIKSLALFKRGDWLHLFLLAFPGTSLPLLFIVAGFARTSALVGGFLLQLNGVAGLVFAVILLKERIHQKQGIGILLLLLGSALIIFTGAQDTQKASWQNGLIGDLLIFIGALGLGYSYIPAKRLVQHVNPLPLTSLRLLLGAATLLPVLAFQLLFRTHVLLWQPSPAVLLLALPIYIVTNFCIAYLAQQEGLRLLPAWEIASIMQTVPLFSTIFALLLLHDSMTLMQVAGGALALVGGVIVSVSGVEQNRAAG